jgi:hypothetical protein
VNLGSTGFALPRPAGGEALHLRDKAGIPMRTIAFKVFYLDLRPTENQRVSLVDFASWFFVLIAAAADQKKFTRWRPVSPTSEP